MTTCEHCGKEIEPWKDGDFGYIHVHYEDFVGCKHPAEPSTEGTQPVCRLCGSSPICEDGRCFACRLEERTQADVIVAAESSVPQAAQEDRCSDCPRLWDTEGPRCDDCPPLASTSIPAPAAQVDAKERVLAVYPDAHEGHCESNGEPFDDDCIYSSWKQPVTILARAQSWHHNNLWEIAANNLPAPAAQIDVPEGPREESVGFRGTEDTHIAAVLVSVAQVDAPKNESAIQLAVLLEYDSRDEITIARLKDARWVNAHGVQGSDALIALKENLLSVLENPEKWESPSEPAVAQTELPPARYTDAEFEQAKSELSDKGARYERALRYARERELREYITRVTSLTQRLQEVQASHDALLVALVSANSSTPRPMFQQAIDAAKHLIKETKNE